MSSMPTITLQVGQCGNQLGATFWQALREQQSRSSSGSSSICREFFAQSAEGAAAAAVEGPGTRHLWADPRCICIDSEAKVVKQSGSSTHAPAGSQRPGVHVLGHGGGCGNNW